MIKVMLIMSIVLAMVYAGLARKKIGDNLVSVSSISYIFPSWMFTAFFGLESILLAPSIFEHMPEDWQFIGFISLFGLWAVAASPYFHTEAKVLHYFGGYLFCVAAQVIVAFNQPFLLLGWLPVVCYVISGLLTKNKREDETFWAEVTAYSILVICLIF